MTTRLTMIVVSGLVAIFTALATAYFLANFERAEAEVYVGFRGEARYNPFLAAEQFLQHLGHQSDSRVRRGLTKELPEVTDTLFLADGELFFTANEVDALLAWADSGGHLMVAAPNGDSVEPSPLIAALGIRLVDSVAAGSDDEAAAHDDVITPADDGQIKSDDAGTPADDGEPTTDDADTPASGGQITTDGTDAAFDAVATVTHDIDSSQDTLDIQWQTRKRLQAEQPTVWTSLIDAAGIVTLTRGLGNGYITVLPSASFLHNGPIGIGDHARLLAWLVTDPGAPGKIWFVLANGFPPLWQLLWQYAWPAMIGAALLLMAFLFAASGRFGPLLGTPPPVRRSLAEHVDACGTYLHRAHADAELITAVRDMIAQSLESRHHGIMSASRADQAAMLARHTGMDEAQVTELMTSDVSNSQREFTARIERLQSLWKSL